MGRQSRRIVRVDLQVITVIGACSESFDWSLIVIPIIDVLFVVGNLQSILSDITVLSVKHAISRFCRRTRLDIVGQISNSRWDRARSWGA